MITQFRDWDLNRHAYAKEWKERTGGKVMGYFCTYVPEEILYAANILPVRILGSHEQNDVTEPHIFGMFCPFCRDCLAQGLKGRYDYLDGIMIAQSCLHIRQAYTSWTKHIPIDFQYYLPMPNNVQSPHATPYLTAEYIQFKEAVEKWIGKEITPDDLQRGIDIMNENRSLIHEIYNYKKMDNPPLSGEESMEVAITQQMVDKREHSVAMRKLLDEIAAGGKSTKNTSGTRLMILGSENDDIPFVRMVESVNGTVVTDDHCIGTRYFWNNVEPGEDLITSIAQRYIDRPACPSKDWIERTRIPHILSIAKEFGVKGAIVIQQKFCDPHELDIPAIIKSLNANDIKTLFLEFDVTVPLGQFKIRVEAFLEMLQEDDLF
ncbi:MAG: benzoyl-CoA reductase, bzd-type, subunit N [Candidatus Kapabacteria bacterium]|nr:benzoyl-CoA reductase, bzd-type, subunit N [Candidatus Kapabacteria bacterium]